jgi:hypothetical protein
LSAVPLAEDEAVRAGAGRQRDEAVCLRRAGVDLGRRRGVVVREAVRGRAEDEQQRSRDQQARANQ